MLDAMKRLVDEDGGVRAKQVLEDFPQLVPALLEMQRRLGMVTVAAASNIVFEGNVLRINQVAPPAAAAVAVAPLLPVVSMEVSASSGGGSSITEEEQQQEQQMLYQQHLIQQASRAGCLTFALLLFLDATD